MGEQSRRVLFRVFPEMEGMVERGTRTTKGKGGKNISHCSHTPCRVPLRKPSCISVSLSFNAIKF